MSADPRSNISFGDRYSTVFVLVGVCCVIAGGLVAAVARPLSLAEGSWLAAFLVLVGGVAQGAFGMAQAALAPRPPSRIAFASELVAWNAGCAAVIAGTLLRMSPMVDAGGILLAVTLVLLLRQTRRASAGTVGSRWLLIGLRALVVVLLVSIPIGLVLAVLRRG